MASSVTNINFAVNSTSIDVTTALEPLFGQVMRLYPNPASDVLHLEISLDKSVDLQIQMIDMLGRSRYSQQQHLAAGDQQIKIDQIRDLIERIFSSPPERRRRSWTSGTGRT